MASVDRFPYSSAPVRQVKAIQFSVWDPAEIVSGALGKYAWSLRELTAACPRRKPTLLPKSRPAIHMKRARQSLAACRIPVWGPWTVAASVPPTVQIRTTALGISATLPWLGLCTTSGSSKQSFAFCAVSAITRRDC